MQVGIIGLPNVGKSTLFKALTKKQVNVSNYPFCTIDPNVGVVAVPDERLDKIFNITKSAEKIPTTIEFVDIAGLVKNAHQGEGLGNQFLSHIREVDAIIEVLRNFEDKNIAHVEGALNPERDKDIVHLELVMADLQTLNKRLEKVNKEAKTGDKEKLKLLNLLNKLKKILEDGELTSECELEKEEKLLIKDLNLLTLKPIIYVENIGEKLVAPAFPPAGRAGRQDKSGLKTGVTKINIGEKLVTPSFSSDKLEIDAKNEAELADLSESELKELGMKSTGLDKLIQASYDILNLITFFTFNQKETRAWTVEKGSKAPQAAGRIHTDFEKGFIRAEVINWQDFIKAGGEQQAKEKGLIRTEGKEYVVQDGDVIYFRIN